MASLILVRLFTLNTLRGSAQSSRPIRAGTDEDLIEPNVGNRGIGLKCHVLQRALHPFALDRVALLRRVRHLSVNGRHHLGVGAPSNLGSDVLCLQPHHLVEVRALITLKRAPVRDSLLPVPALRRKRPPFEIGDCFFIDSNEAGTGARLDAILQSVADSMENPESIRPHTRCVAYPLAHDLR